MEGESDVRITRGSQFSRDFLCGELPSICVRARTLMSGSRWWTPRDEGRNFKRATISSPEGAMALEIVLKWEFMTKYTDQPVSFQGYFRLGILRGTTRREVVKNKLDPREYSEPNRIFSRDKSRLVWTCLCSLNRKANELLRLAVCKESLNANEESEDKETGGFPNRTIYSEETKRWYAKNYNLKLNLENRCWAPRQHSNLFSYPYLDIYWAPSEMVPQHWVPGGLV